MVNWKAKIKAKPNTTAILEPKVTNLHSIWGVKAYKIWVT